MDESHFTFMVFCYSLCKDNGQSHLVIRGNIKELLTSTFWLTRRRRSYTFTSHSVFYLFIYLFVTFHHFQLPINKWIGFCEQQRVPFEGKLMAGSQVSQRGQKQKHDSLQWLNIGRINKSGVKSEYNKPVCEGNDCEFMCKQTHTVSRLWPQNKKRSSCDIFKH